MRIFSFFIGVIALTIGVSGLFAGRWTEAWGGLAVAAVCGLLLWRSLRNPEVTRKAGRQAKIAFSAFPGPGLEGPGTFAQVKDLQGQTWDVVLDRTPETGDFERYGSFHPGWLWLSEDDLPRKVKISYANTWESRDVRSAVKV